MKYNENNIIGKEEDDTTDFKKEYNNKDVAKDICAFANTLKESHIYYGIITKNDSDLSPGIVIDFNPLINFENIKQSIENIIKNNIFPSPDIILEYNQVKSFITLTIRPTEELCEYSNKKGCYESALRIKHRTKTKFSYNEKREISERKEIYKIYNILQFFYCN